MPGICRLCLNERDLRESHIVPKWAWKRARADSTEKNPNPVVFMDDVVLQTSKQVVEELLCHDCEQRFGKVEDYIARITFQPDNTAPLLDLVGDVLLQTNRTRAVPAGKLNHEFVTFFGVSVIWRASVSKSVPACSLGPKYEEQFRRYLLGEVGLPTACALAVAFSDLQIEGAGNMAAICTTPTTERLDGHHVHRFPIFGLMYCLAVGNRLPQWAKTACHARSPEHLLLLSPQDDLIRWLGPWMMKARPVGSLAKRS